MVNAGTKRFSRAEKLFLLAAAAAAAICIALAFWFAVPLRREDGAKTGGLTLAQALRVDLNTADIEALCTLPGVGESRARAIINYRVSNGRFKAVADAANVPGITEAVVESWAEIAYVS